MIKSVLTLHNISKSFSTDGQHIKAVDSVTLNIGKGEIFGLLGPNGAGKTTLISILCGFLIPDTGRAEIFGMDCTKQSQKIHKRMNFASGFSGISEFFNAEELLNFYCMVYNLDNRKKRIETALKLTGLYEHRKRRPSDFSSGLGRRFLISKAILNDPELLLLDEPTVGLDVESAGKLRLLIKDMKKQGKTILLTTHNMREAEELCDRIGLIKDGKIIACGKFQDLKKKFFPFEVIEVSCTEPKKIEKIISKMKSIVRIEKSETNLKLYINGDSELAKIFDAIISSKAGIRSMNMVEPELEDLYTKLMRVNKHE
ncbi:ABC transporter ATP-binding protein [Candidatus Micrarchaeota archaeon]|nr:ABC transporter ATP-binding protein [Candidatus Micrarchaeota archaeon]MBU1165528.1 ABC transporter ATP-binding protein [Candidatus Micrarchaeota archaeon]MBU1886529.1 ABC transporter ATP-binding protein [Candidatus Micrarchaeota archaeon]